MDFPGAPVVKSRPNNAGDMGSIPGLGRFHMLRGSWACAPQLPRLLWSWSQGAETTETHISWSLCSGTGEATALRSPGTTARE